METTIELTGEFYVKGLPTNKFTDKILNQLRMTGRFTGNCDYLESNNTGIGEWRTKRYLKFSSIKISKKNCVYLEFEGLFNANGLPHPVRNPLKGLRTGVVLTKPILYIEKKRNFPTSQKIIRETISQPNSSGCSHPTFSAISNFWGATTFCTSCGKGKGQIDTEDAMKSCWQCRERKEYCPLHGLFAPI